VQHAPFTYPTDAVPTLCSFATVAVAAIALAAPAVARPTGRTRSTQPPPPAYTVDNGDVYEHDTSSSTSTAACNATVSAATWSYAVSSFTDLVAEISLEFCNVNKYGYWEYDADIKQKDKYIQAVASLLLQSKLKCETSGKYALACASTWAGAYSFAGAAYEAYASAWADVSNDLSHCNCAVDVLANADAVTSNWGEIWVAIYQGLDDSVCASSCAPPPHVLCLLLLLRARARLSALRLRMLPTCCAARWRCTRMPHSSGGCRRRKPRQRPVHEEHRVRGQPGAQLLGQGHRHCHQQRQV
jgi:hypothetical protein